MVTLPIPITYPSPYPQLFHQMVTHLTGLEASSTRLRPHIYLNDEDRADAKQFLEDEGLTGTAPLVAIFPTMRQSSQTWPIQHFAELCNTLGRKGVSVVLAGAASDQAALETLAARCREAPPVIAAGRLPVRALCAFLSECDLAITTDSGGRHIANAAGIPVLFFRNLRSFETETGVYCESEQDLLPPRGLLSCDEQDALLKSITAQRVVETILPMLDRSPTAPSSALTH